MLDSNTTQALLLSYVAALGTTVGGGIILAFPRLNFEQLGILAGLAEAFPAWWKNDSWSHCKPLYTIVRRFTYQMYPGQFTRLYCKCCTEPRELASRVGRH